MKSFEEFMNENNVNESADYPYKAIMFSGGGASTTFKFAFTEDKVAAAGDHTNVGWDEWKKSNKQDTSDDKMKDRIVKALMNEVSQFNLKVELNTKLKSARSFEEKVDMILKTTKRKITKTGVKTKLNLF